MLLSSTRQKELHIFGIKNISTGTQRLASLVALLVGCLSAGGLRAQDFETDIRPLLTTYCVDCHSGSDPESNVDFSLIKSKAQIKKSLGLWESVVEHLNSQTMPPEDQAQPTNEERNKVYRWYDELVSTIEARPAGFRPRRLSVVEYRNSLRSVLGFDLEVAVVEAEQTVAQKSLVIKLLPLDPPGDSGFKNDTHNNPLSVVSWDQYSFLIDSALEELFSQRRGAELALLLGQKKGSANRLDTFTGDPNQSHLEDLFQTILSRAYRRPVDAKELATVMKRLEGMREENLVTQTKFEIKTALMSPRFLYRGMAVSGKQGRQAVDPFELAERLSYFMWSDMPDNRLMSLASTGALANEKVLHAELDRMLASEKSRALADVFATEWLTLSEIDLASKNVPIRTALKSQPLDFLNYLFTQNRPLLEIVDSDITFINPHTAHMYGADAKQMVKYVKQRGIEMESVPNQRINLVETKERGGILTMPGILAMNKGPILRGHWILDRIVGEHLPEPPMNISPVARNKRGEKLTFRERFEEHRANAACASCHDKIDPLGFTLDTYGAGGDYLLKPNALKKKKKKNKDKMPVDLATIDTSGKLPSGEEFLNVDGLKKILTSSQRTVVIRNIVERTMSYALCRKLQYFDKPTVDQIVKKMDETNGTWGDLFHAVAGSVAFRETIILGK